MKRDKGECKRWKREKDDRAERKVGREQQEGCRSDYDNQYFY